MISLLITTTALALGGLLLAAGVSKLQQPSRTAAAIDAYAILPAGAGARLWPAIASVELLLGAALLLPGSRALAAAMAAVLFIVYALLIARAVSGGDADFDCGCGSASASLRPSRALALRNGVLAAAALAVALVDAGESPPAWWICIALALLLLGINAIIDRLIARAQWPTDD